MSRHQKKKLYFMLLSLINTIELIVFILFLAVEELDTGFFSVN
jgi:hypothetical protein